MRLGKTRMLGALALILISPITLYGVLRGASGAPPQPRQLHTTQPLMTGWRFVIDDKLTDAAALAANGAGWQPVSPMRRRRTSAASAGTG